MFTILETEAYSRWFAGLRDREARARILVRLRRISLGNFGDMAPVGESVSELRIHHGPGYRVYLVRKGEEVLILLGGGDKRTQAHDISAAKALARKL